MLDDLYLIFKELMMYIANKKIIQQINFQINTPYIIIQHNKTLLFRNHGQYIIY